MLPHFKKMKFNKLQRAHKLKGFTKAYSKNVLKRQFNRFNKIKEFCDLIS